mmetsp:Transcript_63712/g.114683  ORF Transcript_63712/g.114683 Transcript_63712/m.114683 type:complete len:216 (-) Transcript_63712:117-764(-)
MAAHHGRAGDHQLEILQHVVHQINAALHHGRSFDHHQITDGRSFFAALDKGKTGALTRGEVAHGLKRLDVALEPSLMDMFVNSMDENHNGHIELHGFLHALNRHTWQGGAPAQPAAPVNYGAPAPAPPAASPPPVAAPPQQQFAGYPQQPAPYAQYQPVAQASYNVSTAPALSAVVAHQHHEVSMCACDVASSDSEYDSEAEELQLKKKTKQGCC